MKFLLVVLIGSAVGVVVDHFLKIEYPPGVLQQFSHKFFYVYLGILVARSVRRPKSLKPSNP